MKKTLKYIKETINKASLSPAEKEYIKNVLISDMNARPVINAAASRRQYQQSHSGLYRLLTTKPMLASLIIAVVLVTGGGASLAAEQTVPGDVLYPVKVGVNEEVRAVLSFSQTAKATWAIERAERRMEEAEKLAVEEKLDTQNRATLSASLNSHVAQASYIAKQLSSEGDFFAASSIQSHIEASLSGHARVLLGLTSSTSTETSIRIADFVIEVADEAKESSAVRERSELELERFERPSVREAAENKLQAAEAKLVEVHTFINRNEHRVNAVVLNEVNAVMAEAQVVLDAGKTQLEADLYSEAFASFQASLRLAQEAKVIMSASLKLRPEALLDFRGSQTDASATSTGQVDAGADEDATDENPDPLINQLRIDIDGIIDRALKIKNRTEGGVQNRQENGNDVERESGEIEADNRGIEIDIQSRTDTEVETEQDGGSTINSNINVNINSN